MNVNIRRNFSSHWLELFQKIFNLVIVTIDGKSLRDSRHVESAFIPFVSFGDLDNNTFKGLTSLLSVEQEIQYDEHT
jgi:hypothetical protein